MSSAASPLPPRLILLKQEPNSPAREASAADSSSASTPCSISSCTRLTDYGTELNRDFDILTRLEDRLAREVEHEELQAAIARFALVHGHTPSIRQVALQLSFEDREAGDDAAGSPGHTQHSDGPEAAVAAVAISAPQFFGPARTLHDDRTSTGLLLHHRFTGSPVGSCSTPSPASRFAQASPPSRAGTPERQASEWPAPRDQLREPQPRHANKGLFGPCSPTPPASCQEPDVPLHAAPAARPFVPGLNLFSIKKKSPLVRAGAASTAGAAPGPLHLAAVPDAAASCPPDTARGSPTEILRMLLPSACKPRGGGLKASAGGATAPREWAQHGTAALESLGTVAEWAAAAAAAAEGDGFGDYPSGRLIGSPRISMDDVDQHETGHRKTTPSKCMGGARAPGDPQPAGMKAPPSTTATPSKRHTLGARGKRHHHSSSPHKGSDQDPAHQPCDASQADRPHAAPGQPGAAWDVRAEPAYRSTGNEPGAEGCTSPADSAVRKDTPSKKAPFSLAAVVASRAAAAACSDAALPWTDAPRPAGAAPRSVPRLQLPTAAAAMAPGLGPFLPMTSRRTARAAGPASARGPHLLLAQPAACSQPPQQPSLRAAHAPPASGSRTRRLSICMPSTLLFGQGPLTVRRIAAGASTGVPSHALSTVFWAASEDESSDDDDDDSEAYDERQEEEDEYGAYAPEHDAYDEYGMTDGVQMALEAASQVFTAAAAAAAAAAGHGSTTHARPGPNGVQAAGADRQGLPLQQGRRQDRRARRAARRVQQEEDTDLCGGGLMLPEELWDAWERLSDGQKGRQYRLLESLTQVERITCTSYSTVSKACHQGQPVVVKIYDVAERDKLANAFAEIGVLLHLAGWPGAVGLLDYGRHEDKVMLMLESCDHSLKDWCDSQRFDVDTGPEYISECLRLWCTLTEMVADLHERFHVAHCDLKPGNVLLTGGLLRLADFSESMLFNGAPLLLDQARGTVSYQPPEMIHAHSVDARKADVWAMGCILYEIVTGEVLFKGPADCMRAVPAGGGVAARQRHQRRSQAGRSTGGGDGRRTRAEQRHAPDAAQWQPQAAAAAEAAAGASEQQRRAMPEVAAKLVRSGGREDAAEDGTAAGPRSQPPRVPRLTLGLTRPPVGGSQALRPAHPAPPPAAFPQQQHHASYSTQAATAGPHLLPQFLLMAGGGGTGRSLELIAEGSVCTEGAPSSRASDPWPGPSAGNTAPTTARSLAFDTARSAAAHDTARSQGTSCASGWPPPPPPSDGTARSVAASEWTLAAAAGPGGGGGPVSDRSTARTGGGSAAAAVTAGAAFSGRGESGWCDGAEGVVPAVAAVAGLLPPHRRMRHSVATQCADPAGPDWLTTEEADRMRIMCDEPPSFVAVAYDGGGSASGGGASSRSGYGGCAGEVAASEGKEDLYKPRPLSGADGPSLCDDLLGLLRAVLVEDHARPSMRQVAAVAAQVLRRHCPAAALPPAPPAVPLAPPCAAASAAAAPDSGCGGVVMGPRCADARLCSVAENDEGGSEGGAGAGGGEAGGAILAEQAWLQPVVVRAPKLRLPGSAAALLHPAPAPDPEPGCHGAAARAGSMDVPMELLSPGAGTAAAAYGGGGGGGDVGLWGSSRAVSLFDACQPLLTTRGGRPVSRSWQRFLAVPGGYGGGR